MKQFTYVVTDPLGCHARPAGLIVKKAGEFQASVKISNGVKEGDAKRILSLMSLAIKQGNEIKISVDGPDEGPCATALEAFLKANL